MKQTLVGLAAVIVLGGSGIAHAADLVPVGYGVACYKVPESKAVVCVASGKLASLAVGISHQLVTVVDLKKGKSIYTAKQRGGTAIRPAAKPVPIAYGVACYKVTKNKMVVCATNGKRASLGVGISDQLVTVVDLTKGKALYTAKQR